MHRRSPLLLPPRRSDPLPAWNPCVGRTIPDEARAGWNTFPGLTKEYRVPGLREAAAERIETRTMNIVRRFALLAAVPLIRSSFLFFLFLPLPAAAEEPSCIACHEALGTGTSVHAALSMGCAACHSAVDAAGVPHKITNRNPKGLTSKMRDLCYSCHDKKPFMKNTVHGAILLGCTSCHDPHASKHAKLLKEDIPGLCISCHKDRFSPGAGGSHALAGNEACAGCHDPHASDTPKLMQSGLSRPTALAANK